MGPLRRRLVLLPLLVASGPAWAGEVCAKVRPDWDGEPVSAWSEAILILGSPISLILIVASVIAIRFRSAWGALAVCVAWSFLASAFTFFDPTGGTRAAAAVEGCVGPSSLFVAAVGVICVGMILLTGTPGKPDPEGDQE